MVETNDGLLLRPHIMENYTTKRNSQQLEISAVMS